MALSLANPGKPCLNPTETTYASIPQAEASRNNGNIRISMCNHACMIACCYRLNCEFF